MDLEAKQKNIPPCDLYYDMKYTLPHLTFLNINNGNLCCPNVGVLQWWDNVYIDNFFSSWHSILWFSLSQSSFIELFCFTLVIQKVIEGIVMHRQLFQVKLAQIVQLGSLKWVCWTCILVVEPCLLVYALAHPYLE